MSADLHPFLTTLLQATNAHDLDALVDCLDTFYRNETPAHPSRDFAGREQVRGNWRQISPSCPTSTPGFCAGPATATTPPDRHRHRNHPQRHSVLTPLKALASGISAAPPQPVAQKVQDA